MSYSYTAASLALTFFGFYSIVLGLHQINDKEGTKLKMLRQSTCGYIGIRIFLVGVTLFASMLAASGFSAASTITTSSPSVSAGRVPKLALKANDFLNSIGVDTHIAQGIDNAPQVATSLTYAGIRNIRDDGSTNPATIQAWLNVHAASGAKLSLLPINGNIADSISEYEQMAVAGALLAAEGPNEPNNFPVTYNGQTSGYTTTFMSVAQFQRDLYAAVKADIKLAGIPVFASSEAGGSEPDNVGLQFLTITGGAGSSMPDGTKYADYANTHNYVLGNGMTHVVDNNAWGAEAPATPAGPWDGPYGEYGVTWHKGFSGYSISQLQILPKVTTETGWPTVGRNSISEDQQGKLFINLYLDAFKQGWSYTFIYMLRDDPNQGYWGLFHKDYTPKLSGTYLHNLTTILADNSSSFTPGKVNYFISNEPEAVHDLLLQKSNGTMELIVWGEQIRGQNNVTLNLGAKDELVKVYDPTIGVAQIKIFTDVNSIPLTLSDHALVIEFGATTTHAAASVSRAAALSKQFGARLKNQPPRSLSRSVIGHTGRLRASLDWNANVVSNIRRACEL
jgi:hypothetical protein